MLSVTDSCVQPVWMDTMAKISHVTEFPLYFLSLQLNRFREFSHPISLPLEHFLSGVPSTVYPLMFPFLKIAAPHGAATCNCCDAVPLIRLDLLLNSLGNRMKTAISYAVIHWSYTNCFPCNHTFITLTCMCRDQKNQIYLYLHLPIPCTWMYECTCEQGKFECCFCAKFEWS